MIKKWDGKGRPIGIVKHATIIGYDVIDTITYQFEMKGYAVNFCVKNDISLSKIHANYGECILVQHML